MSEDRKTGYVLIHRGLIGNPQFRGKDDEYSAMWIVTHAAWKETTVRVNREAVKLERGECAYALSYLARAWECSKTSASRILKHLEKTGFVRTRAERGYTRIYVINYDTYQTPTNNGGTQPETQTGTRAERGRNAGGTNKKEVNTLNKNNAPSRYRFEGKVVRITQDDFERWQQAYPNINLQAECQAYDDWVQAQPEATRKDWFHRLSGTLRKRNDEKKPIPKRNVPDKMVPEDWGVGVGGNA